MVNLFQKTIKTLLCFVVVFSLHGSAWAQSPSSLDNQLSDVSIQFSPLSPRAGDNVDLELSSYSIDLNTAKITWYVDGVAKADGLGIKTFTVIAKNSGQTTAIRAVVETTDGVSKEASTEITPAGVDIIVEPQSYTPPFYKGKPLFINQGTARVVAVPDVVVGGKKIDPKNLIFKWQKDGTILSSASGAGKDSLVVDGTIPVRDIDIGVSVFNSQGQQVASAEKILSAADPKILFYENNPLYGVLFNKSISGNYYLGQKEELTVVAKPFFFDLSSDSGSDASYKWSVNGNPVSAAGKTNELLLRQTTPNLKGTASISLSINNVVRIFQFADNNFSVSFGI